MEKIQRSFEPKVAPEFDPTFDLREVEVQAAQTARIMLTDCIDPALTHEHRFEAISALIEELVEDKGNHFIVEALRERLSYEKVLLTLEYSDEEFSLMI
jgi:hypothetical protein